jgi:hypothetical protein
MQGIDKMLKPILGLLEVSVPDSSPENDASKFIEGLIVDYIPEDLPKDLIRKFVVDSVNKNPEDFDKILRELFIKILQYFNRKPKEGASL